MPTAAPGLPPTRFLVGGIAYIGTFSEEQETDYASGRESVPDNNWSTWDKAGHFHAFDTRTGELPTLLSRSEHEPCNGECGPDGCDGYPITRWSCVICGEDVVPQYHELVRNVAVSTMRWWEATIEGPMIPPSPGNRISVLIERDGEPTRFGTAVVTSMTYESGQPAVMELVGSRALGWRPLETKEKAG